MAGSGALPYDKDMERRVLASLDNLAALYGFDLPDVSGKPFPYNLCLAFRCAEDRLKERNRDLHLLLLEVEGKVQVATAKTAGMDATLFYLPVQPLWTLLQDRRRKAEAQLLLSVFAYLRQVAGVPYFGEYSYIGSQYAMLREWITEDGFEDKTERDRCLSPLLAALHFGERTGKQIAHPYHLARFADRLQSFDRAGKFAETLREAANEFMYLYQTYPDRKLTDNVHEGILYPLEEQRIYLEQMVSFVWDEEGRLAEQLFEMVTNELNEMSAMDEPLSLQFFDTPQAEERNGLGFEEKLYGLLHDLSDVLRMV